MEFIASLLRCECDTTSDVPEKPDYINFGGDDHATNRMLETLMKKPTMKGISALLCQCIIVLQNSNLNVDANRAASEVLRNTIAFFADPHCGLLAVCHRHGTDFTTEQDRRLVLRLLYY